MSGIRRFIQFPHPGSEHRPNADGRIAWNPLRHNGNDVSHARKFLELNGAWLEKDELRKGRLWAWSEWEPESELVKALTRPTPQHPRYLWNPYWMKKRRYVGLHNTDPFIYDGFYYTDCKQIALPGLRRLDAGSIVAFGSAKDGQWVLDTLLVVRDSIDHDQATFSERLKGRVPDAFWDVTLGPTYAHARADQKRRLYIGATVDNPLSGMYSFFPCMPAGNSSGFARPAINLPEKHFSKALLRGAKGHKADAEPLALTTLQQLWSSIIAQVQKQGLRLGVWAASPERRNESNDS